MGVQVSKGNEVAEIMFQDIEREKMKADVNATSVEEDTVNEVLMEEKSETKEENMNGITSARTKYPGK